MDWTRERTTSANRRTGGDGRTKQPTVVLSGLWPTSVSQRAIVVGASRKSRAISD